jgi:hypothetical protein
LGGLGGAKRRQAAHGQAKKDYSFHSLCIGKETRLCEALPKTRAHFRRLEKAPETGLSTSIFFTALRQRSISVSIPCAFR